MIMKSNRIGLGKGRGTGYKNLIKTDRVVHSNSGKGRKTYSNPTARKMEKQNIPTGRKVVKEYTVYKFDDLPKETKEKALEQYRDINVDHDWWKQDGLLDLSEKEMKDSGIKPLSKNWYDKPLEADKIHTKGEEYPAYTGLVKYKIGVFDFDRYNYIQFEDVKITDKEVFRKFLGIDKALWDKADYIFENEGETDTRLQWEHKELDDFTPKETSQLLEGTTRFAQKVDESLGMLRDQYYDLLTDKKVAETLRINEYEFTDDGKIH